MSEPFGALPPSPFQEGVRSCAKRLPANYFGRKSASLLLGPAGGRSGRAFDVTVFGSQKARLHPFDNICEKRVYLTPQFWDRKERAFLGDLISELSAKGFNFVDVGANVGLYSLFARAAAKRAGAEFMAVCIEADPEMAARLRFNIDASNAEGEICVFNCAASNSNIALPFSVNRKSRGLSRVDDSGKVTIVARPLAEIIAEAGLSRIDAMKVDIEGHEFQAMSGFFQDAPISLHPTAIILEASHDDEARSAETVVSGAGYLTRFRTERNAVMIKDRPRASR